MIRRARAVLALSLPVLMVGLPAGCVSQANWPPVPEDIAFNDPNTPATMDVMAAGLRWAISKYPPEGSAAALTPPPPPRRPSDPPAPTRAAINLPAGVKPYTYLRVADIAGGARGGIVPITEETKSLPTYHVGWVRIRGDEAYMTVFRPVLAIGGKPTDRPIYQEVRLGLRGGLRPWSVDSIRPWEVGSRPAPELNFYVPAPLPEEPAPSPNPPSEPTFRPERRDAPPPERVEPSTMESSATGG